MLTPHINDANREVQLRRRDLEPDSFGGQPLQGEKRVAAQKELDKLKKTEEKA